MLIEPIARVKLGETVLKRLLGLFSGRQLNPGDQLPAERALAEQLGVSRVTIREALKALSAMGLIEMRHGRGTFVRSHAPGALTRPITASLAFPGVSVLELVEARRVIELHTVGQAALYRGKEDLAKLSGILDGMEKAFGSPERYIDLDTEFHLTIARCAENRALLILLEAIRDILRDDLIGSVRPSGKAAMYGRHHREIYGAIRAKNAKFAQRIMASHLGRLEQEIAESCRQRGEELGKRRAVRGALGPDST